MKNILVIFMTTLILWACQRPAAITKVSAPPVRQETKPSATNDLITISGTVKQVRLEGNFFGIISDRGEKYDPVNLKPEFAQDGLQVQLTAKPATDRMSAHMWGKMIEIVSIEKKTYVEAGSIYNRKWQLIEINDQKVESKAYVEFSKEGRMRGNAGCNSMGGAAVVESNQIKFSNLISTKMACTDSKQMETENKLLKALQNTTQYAIENNILKIAGNENIQLKFKAETK